jgi:hypothetical protein
MAEQICLRCGMMWDVNASRKANDFCESCRARRTTKIGACLPWHGRFASDLTTPIHETGLPVMPGKRACGNSDCVNSNHLERVEK